MAKNKKERNFTTTAGASINIVTGKIKNEIGNILPNSRKKRKINKFESGKIITSDWSTILMGMQTLRQLIEKGLSSIDMQAMAGKDDISKIKKYIYEYSSVIRMLMSKTSSLIEHEIIIQSNIDFIEESYDILQAARDGILVKSEKRIEIINGKEKEIKYDTSMTETEVNDVLEKYQRMKDDIALRKLENYLGIGLSIAGIIGTISKEKKEIKTEKTYLEGLVTLSVVAARGLNIFNGFMREKDRDKYYNVSKQRSNSKRAILEKEQISDNDKKREIEHFKELFKYEYKLDNKIDNKHFFIELTSEVIIALLTGVFINSKVATKENGKIDGKDFASAIISMGNARAQGSEMFRKINFLLRDQKRENDFKIIYKNIQEIMRQMEEKVYPIQGASHSFDSFSIRNLEGKFYPKKDYETGKVTYSTTIKVPEFSIKRGDIVLISGESGAGKSTFLRFLKRGDINNLQAIKLNSGEMVDSLGKEYISFKPSTELGNESNVLYQLTGKNSVSSLSKQEKIKIMSILKELKFNSKDLLENLASKKFMEFSTGQQRRLALSKLFYRIDDATSVVIVDEPVGNVEDKLIREQLTMIVRYAKEKNVMLILTTHRLDLVENLATKRYNINKDGIMEQMQIHEKQKNEGR